MHLTLSDWRSCSSRTLVKPAWACLKIGGFLLKPENSTNTRHTHMETCNGTLLADSFPRPGRASVLFRSALNWRGQNLGIRMSQGSISIYVKLMPFCRFHSEDPRKNVAIKRMCILQNDNCPEGRLVPMESCQKSISRVIVCGLERVEASHFFGAFRQGMLGLENFLPTNEWVFSIKPLKVRLNF